MDTLRQLNIEAETTGADVYLFTRQPVAAPQGEQKRRGERGADLPGSGEPVDGKQDHIHIYTRGQRNAPALARMSYKYFSLFAPHLPWNY